MDPIESKITTLSFRFLCQPAICAHFRKFARVVCHHRYAIYVSQLCHGAGTAGLGFRKFPRSFAGKNTWYRCFIYVAWADYRSDCSWLGGKLFCAWYFYHVEYAHGGGTYYCGQENCAKQKFIDNRLIIDYYSTICSLQSIRSPINSSQISPELTD